MRQEGYGRKWNLCLFGGLVERFCEGGLHPRAARRDFKLEVNWCGTRLDVLLGDIASNAIVVEPLAQLFEAAKTSSAETA